MPDPPARPRRAEPLRASRIGTLADAPEAADAGPERQQEADAPPRHRWALVLAAAVGVGLAMLGVVYGIVAIVVYPAAMSSADGLDSPFVRTAFLRVALPAGIVSGLAAGAIVGAWLARGGRLPTDRASMFDR
jgi:hypothetical protein